MSEHAQKLGLLIGLQEKDIALDKVRHAADAIPQKIEQQKQLIAQLKTDAEDRKKTLLQLQMKRKEKELELDSKENLIKKHTGELNAVKSNDSYRALLIEIESAKQDKSALESEILEIMESVDKESATLKSGEADQKKREAEMQAVITSLEAEMNAVKAQVEAQLRERNEYAAQVPADALRNYEYVRESRQGVAIVPIEGESCGGCHMVLRPQVINEVIKGQEVVLCDSCSRILFKK